MMMLEITTGSSCSCSCPRCSTEQDFEIDKAPLAGEIELTCTSCRNRVRGEPGSVSPLARDAEGAA